MFFDLFFSFNISLCLYGIENQRFVFDFSLKTLIVKNR